MTLPSPADIQRFYAAAALGLRFLEQREGRGRRFGEGANAGWRALGGALEPRDRLDLLLRDAAASSPLAFSPRLVFGIEALAEDEPFGPEWPQATEAVASASLKAAAEAAPLSWSELFDGVSAVCGLASPRESGMVASAGITPATRVLFAGRGVLRGLAAQAAAGAGFDLGDQTLFVTGSAAERQLFGVVLLATGARGRPRMLVPSRATAEHARALGFSSATVALVDDDAARADRDAVDALYREMIG